MLPVLFGLIAAMLFSFGAYAVYGLEGVMSLPWIDNVFWALILTGIIVAAVNAIWNCLGCRIGKKLFSAKLSSLLCNDTTCEH